MKQYFDYGSLMVIVITFVLFVIALFAKGFTHDLLLEAGVFLVSVKIIMIGYKSSKEHERILKELQDIASSLKQ